MLPVDQMTQLGAKGLLLYLAVRALSERRNPINQCLWLVLFVSYTVCASHKCRVSGNVCCPFTPSMAAVQANDITARNRKSDRLFLSPHV